MAKAKRICKVCGREYEYCHTPKTSETFRWQDVVCCYDHGVIYLAKIRESRKKQDTADIANSDIKEAEVESVSCETAGEEQSEPEVTVEDEINESIAELAIEL